MSVALIRRKIQPSGRALVIRGSGAVAVRLLARAAQTFTIVSERNGRLGPLCWLGDEVFRVILVLGIAAAACGQSPDPEYATVEQAYQVLHAKDYDGAIALF